jgi:PTS system fructose-specific IIC component
MIRLTRYLRPSQVKLALATTTPDEVPEGWSRERFVWSVKERVLGELLELFVASGRVGNESKLRTDLENRERKSTTGIGGGIAIPHVRTMQAKEFTICFARSVPGVEFGAVDDAPVHIFFGVIAPPYDDKLYLEVYRTIGELLTVETTRGALMEAATAHEVIKVIADLA